MRIGSVPYLNARPLVDALGAGVRLAPPVDLAALLRAGELDAALVPVVEALENPRYQVVDGIGIGCDGPVYSVFLAHEKPIEEWRTVSLDPHSRTSNQLVQTLLAGRAFRFVKREEPADAALWIGDPAIRYRAENPGQSYWDLGTEWKKQTGLPFVFAVWALNPGHVELADRLRAAAVEGLDARSRIATTPLEMRYLTEYIRYEVGTGQKRAIAEFARRIGHGGRDLEWV